jgi:hypothetical protein
MNVNLCIYVGLLNSRGIKTHMKAICLFKQVTTHILRQLIRGGGGHPNRVSTSQMYK